MIILNNHHKQSYAVEENREFLQYHGKFNDDILYTQNVFEMAIIKAVYMSFSVRKLEFIRISWSWYKSTYTYAGNLRRQGFVK